MMNIIEAINFFERLLNETNNKREQKVYESFITILSNLKNKNLSEGQSLSIRYELKSLDLNSNPDNKVLYFRKKLKDFKVYLKAEFSLIPENYYTSIGMSLGMCFGVAIGAAFGTFGISMGLCFGMLIGIVVGRTKDVDAEKQNRVLKTKTN
tara:strand:- start:71482 stop:71937 length:456 start_codon:yes stop_codon:yes gene_type:complete